MTDTHQPPPWHPALSPKQAAYLARCHPKIGNPRYRLISGPRKSSKTTVCLHAVADHLWTVKDAKFSIVCPTITAGDDQGCWTQLTERVLQQWIDADFGMEWVAKSKTKGISRKLICKVTNMHGGVSTVQLDSLQYEHEVEARFKNKGHSGIYLSEASYWKQRKVFDIIKDVLRGEQWNEWDFLLLMDTNPAEEGEDHWLWKLFYDFRVQDGLTGPDREFQKQLDLEEFFVPDNPFLSQFDKDTLFASYGHSADLMARYYYGNWVKAHGNSIFFDYWRPQIHIIGDYETATNREPDILLPEENCFQLRTGWDPGEINHSFHICEVVDLKLLARVKDAEGRESIKEITRRGFKFLDEVVYIGDDDASFHDFVDEVMEKMTWWEKLVGRKLNWINWSDRSAFDRKEPINNVYVHKYVAAQTDGRVILQAADRSAGSVKQRCDITKRLLFENRVWVSRSKCPNLIDTFGALPPGKGNVVVQRTSKYKHCFDSASYILSSESYDEILRPGGPNSGKPSNGLISVPL